MSGGPGRRKSAARRPLAAGIAGLLLIAPAATAGCGGTSDASQTRVFATSGTVAGASEEATATLTPLERGKLRREILAVAEAGVDTWLADDLDTMATYFADDQVEYFRGLHDQYFREGKARVRSHSNPTMDVTDINAAGTEATVEYYFTDDSYFADSTGAALSEPSHRDTTIQFTMVKQSDGTWKIERLFASRETIQ